MCAKTCKDSVMKLMEQRYREFVESNPYIPFKETRDIGLIGYAGFKKSVADFDKAIFDFTMSSKASVIGVGFPVNDWQLNYEAVWMMERHPNFVQIPELHHKFWNLDKIGFDENSAINWNKGWDKLDDVVNRSKKLVLVCSEVEHKRCHRNTIAERLSNMFHIGKVIDLNKGVEVHYG